jgi:hypothetical protein
MAGALRYVSVTGSDRRMDTRGTFGLPANPLPVRCARCTFPDLDFVPQPYLLAKGTADPNEVAEAEVGNLLVRDRTRKVLEAVAPGACRFHPTHDAKTKEPTPWSLAVPTAVVRTATVKASVPRCPACGEPKVAHPGSHYEWLAPPRVSHELFKSAEWASGEATVESNRGYLLHILGQKEFKKPAPGVWMRTGLGRYITFSVRLVSLFKAAGIKGLYPSAFDGATPDPTDRDWVVEQMARLEQVGLVGTAKPTKPPASAARWFAAHLRGNAASNPRVTDWKAVEARLGCRLPKAYKTFVDAVGGKAYRDVDGQEGFSARVLLPGKLDAKSYRLGQVEGAELDGLMFAATGHGDCFCFELSAGGNDYPVYLYDHETGAFEAYAPNFIECVRRFAG